MTVEELIEELKQLPPTAILQVVEAFDGAIPRDIIETSYGYGIVSIIIETHDHATEDGPDE